MKRIFIGICSIILAGRFLQITITTTDGAISRVYGGVSSALFLLFGIYELFEKRFRILYIEPGSAKDQIIFWSIIFVCSLVIGGAALIVPSSLWLKIFIYFLSGMGTLCSIGFILKILKN